MDFEQFTKHSGFKVLAMARLSNTEYSVMLYLINCSVGGMDQVITTEYELAQLIGCDESHLHESLLNLAEREFIKLHYSKTSSSKDFPSLRIGINYDLKRWHLNLNEELSSHHDAIVYPFRHQGEQHLQVFEGKRRPPNLGVERQQPTEDDWRQIYDYFTRGRELSDDELETSADQARFLSETHPTELVLLMLKHFGKRIPTLSLLASSWQHYHELFASETQKIDMLEARQRHVELDKKLRDSAQSYLDKKEDLEFSEDEVKVLEVLLDHSHPRRQLYWAYQISSRYPNLADFFSDNMECMLGVTSSGHVIKKT